MPLCVQFILLDMCVSYVDIYSFLFVKLKFVTREKLRVIVIEIDICAGTYNIMFQERTSWAAEHKAQIKRAVHSIIRTQLYGHIQSFVAFFTVVIQ